MSTTLQVNRVNKTLDIFDSLTKSNTSKVAILRTINLTIFKTDELREKNKVKRQVSECTDALCPQNKPDVKGKDG